MKASIGALAASLLLPVDLASADNKDYPVKCMEDPPHAIEVDGPGDEVCIYRGQALCKDMGDKLGGRWRFGIDKDDHKVKLYGDDAHVVWEDFPGAWKLCIGETRYSMGHSEPYLDIYGRDDFIAQLQCQGVPNKHKPTRLKMTDNEELSRNELYYKGPVDFVKFKRGTIDDWHGENGLWMIKVDVDKYTHKFHDEGFLVINEKYCKWVVDPTPPPSECEDNDSCTDCINDRCAWVPAEGCLSSCDIIADTKCYTKGPVFGWNTLAVCTAAAIDDNNEKLCARRTDCNSCVNTFQIGEGDRKCLWFEDGDFCSSGCNAEGCGVSTCPAPTPPTPSPPKCNFVYNPAVEIWDYHKDEAEAENCTLASITSQEENDKVMELVGALFGFDGAWIGGQRTSLANDDICETGTASNCWQWIDRSIWDYENFADGEPNNAGLLPENKVEFASSGEWNDESGVKTRPAVYKCCE